VSWLTDCRRYSSVSLRSPSHSMKVGVQVFLVYFSPLIYCFPLSPHGNQRFEYFADIYS
jgi:hypothetical protein